MLALEASNVTQERARFALTTKGGCIDWPAKGHKHRDGVSKSDPCPPSPPKPLLPPLRSTNIRTIAPSLTDPSVLCVLRHLLSLLCFQLLVESIVWFCPTLDASSFPHTPPYPPVACIPLDFWAAACCRGAGPSPKTAASPLSATELTRTHFFRKPLLTPPTLPLFKKVRQGPRPHL